MMSQLWFELSEMFHKSPNNICVHEQTKYDNDILSKMGVIQNSVLGQIVTNAYGIVVDNLVRVYANGDEKESHNIYSYNRELEKSFGNKKLFVADDVFGGLYAMNNGAFEGDQGMIWYFAPDTLEWDNLGISYPEFITWISSSNFSDFYSTFIWNDLQKDICDIRFNQGVLIYPFLWSNECTIETADKKVVPFIELISLNLENNKKLGL